MIKFIVDDPIYMPMKATPKSTGYDLKSTTNELIKPGTSQVINTGVKIDFSKADIDLDVQIRSRSGLAARKSLSVLNAPATIDRDYEDYIKIILFNHGQYNATIVQGDRIAQLVLGLLWIDFSRLEEEASLMAKRTGGLGSTGE
jgi:dUTP pyrophosphatase